MRPTIALLFAVCLVACETTEDDDTTDTDVIDQEGPGAFLGGLWRPTNQGAVFDNTELGALDFVAFVPQEEGGSSGRVHFYGGFPDSGVQVCETALYGVGAEGLLTIFDDGPLDSLALLFTEDEDGSLSLENEYGVVERFEADTDPLPASSTCVEAVIDAINTFDLSPSSWSDLLFDGSSIRVPIDEEAHAIDVDAGVIGGATTYASSWRYLVTMQGADGWGTCACGGNESIHRSVPGGADVDEVDTEDLGLPISVESGAWDGAYLWLAGYSYDRSERMLLKVDSDAEPDTLLTSTPMALSSTAMTWHSGMLYALTGDVLVSLNAGTGRATATWKLPTPLDQQSGWGLTSDGTSLYVATRHDGELTVARLSTP